MNFSWLLKLRFDLLYLVLGLPCMLAIAVISEPFSAPDELAHYYRAVQLSRGEFLPVRTVALGRAAAGGHVDAGAAAMGDRVCDPVRRACGIPPRIDAAAIARLRGFHATGSRIVKPFSNTVIYLPLAHAAPAIAITLARAAGLPPLDWLYGGRIADALLACGAILLAIRWLGPAAPLGFAVAMLPMTLYLNGSLSSDAGVIAASLVLAALCRTLACGEPATTRRLATLALTLPLAAIAKPAYIPLVVVPPICALVGRQPRRTIGAVAAISGTTFAVWLIWSIANRDNAFTILADRSIDLPRQIAFIIHRPVAFAAILVGSMTAEAPRALAMMAGWLLSASQIKLPVPLVLTALVSLAAALRLAAPVRMAAMSRAMLAVSLLGCIVLAFTLLYIQFTPVGAPRIEGFQGRYLIPVLPFLVLAVPALPRPAARQKELLTAIVASGGLVAAIATPAYLAYWFTA